MNSFRQHIPAFVTCDDPEEISFETTEQLLALEIVQQYSRHAGFSHFAMSGHLLMEISDGGHVWWVIGYIKHPDQVNLPAWGGGIYRAELSDGTVVDLRPVDVLSTCGNEIRLRDGTTAKWKRDDPK